MVSKEKEPGMTRLTGRLDAITTCTRRTSECRQSMPTGPSLGGLVHTVCLLETAFISLYLSPKRHIKYLRYFSGKRLRYFWYFFFKDIYSKVLYLADVWITLTVQNNHQTLNHLIIHLAYVLGIQAFVDDKCASNTTRFPPFLLLLQPKPYIDTRTLQPLL